MVSNITDFITPLSVVRINQSDKGKTLTFDLIQFRKIFIKDRYSCH